MTPRVGPRRRLLAVVVPVCLAGFAIVAAATVALVTDLAGGTTLAGVGAMLVAALVAERFPVPLAGVDTGGVTLTFVFGVATIVLFGWAAGVLVFFAAPAIMHFVEHRPPIRVAFNAAVFALSAAVGGALATLVGGSDAMSLLAKVVMCASAQYLTNTALVSAVVAADAEKPFVRTLKGSLEMTIVPFALMASAALMLVVLWERAPLFSLALIGPLIAIALYQRSTHRAIRAMQLALTDPLTGVGNHRHFHERLQRELTVAEDTATPLSLCLIDVDDFKTVNDRFGHPAGDRLLSHVASRLRQGGEAFRLGGDEFAVLLPGHDEEQALAAARSIVERIATRDLAEIGRVTASAGVATYAADGIGRDELIRLADSALYWAKEHGKNRVRVYRPAFVELTELRDAPSRPDRAAAYRAAAGLAAAVHARDPSSGSHLRRVAELAAMIAEELAVDRETVELTRVAASIHDLGMLAVPDEILHKAGPLTDAERRILEQHPQLGYRMLEGLGVEPVANCVLHHHERWDGEGYPGRLRGDAIALGARIIFVADAYDAMTSERAYAPPRSSADAVAELARCAGTQFDPKVVAACASVVADGPPAALAV